MKVWETKIIAIDRNTGELTEFISSHYIEAPDFYQANVRVVQTGLPYLYLTGSWYNSFQDVENHQKILRGIKDPKAFVEDITADEFYDWLSLGDREDLDDILEAFKKIEGLEEYVSMIEGYRSYKYPKNDQ